MTSDDGALLREMGFISVAAIVEQHVVLTYFNLDLRIQL